MNYSGDIMSRFDNCKTTFEVVDVLEEHLLEDLRERLIQYWCVIPTSVDDLTCELRSENKFCYEYEGRHSRMYPELTTYIRVCNSKAGWSHEFTLTEDDLCDLKNDDISYKLVLDNIYTKYKYCYQKTYAEEIRQGYEKTAQALIRMFSPQTGQELKPKFCSCCGARLVEGAASCDYCGAVFAIN